MLELCSADTLYELSRKRTGRRVDEAEAKMIMRQVFSAVEYIHQNGFCHRDIKLTNILIDHDGNVKLIDFGFAAYSEEKLRLYCGTPSYMSPEIVEKKRYDGKAVDIWACGVLMYKLLTGQYAFGAEDDEYLEKNIQNVLIDYPFYLTPSCRDLLSQIFQYDPKKRMLIKDVS